MTLKVPAVVYGCDVVSRAADGPTVDPSPKSHAHVAIVLDPAAVDPDPLKLTVTVPINRVAGFGEAVKLAVGSGTAVTESVRVVVSVSPRLSVTVSVIV